MPKTITKIGNSQGLILDAALCELTGLKVGDQINVTVRDGSVVIFTPLRQIVSASAKDLIHCNIELFKCLA